MDKRKRTKRQTTIHNTCT